MSDNLKFPAKADETPAIPIQDLFPAGPVCPFKSPAMQVAAAGGTLAVRQMPVLLRIWPPCLKDRCPAYHPLAIGGPECKAGSQGLILPAEE